MSVREEAEELAAIRVSALLQTFAMPGVNEEQIEQLLKECVAHAFVAGHAKGWRAAKDAVRASIASLDIPL